MRCNNIEVFALSGCAIAFAHLLPGREIMRKGRGRGVEEEFVGKETVQGIVVVDRKAEGTGNGNGPRIAAFIWGGKVKPTPTLPYGRWKGAA